MNTSRTLATLGAAETIARVYGDTETAARLDALAAEVREAGIEEIKPLPICPVCGGNVDVAPRVQCQECDLSFSP